eukprot:XP_024445689.1 uncharacterized protein LOC18107906 isoform X3 [Populus trichocarpa]
MMIHIIRRGSARSTISTVFDEVANAIHGANMQWRARSYAASVPSHMPQSHKAQKRVSKDDRRAMVESYVNNGNKKKELPIVSEPLVKVKNMSTGGAMSDMRTQCDPRAVPLNDVGDTSYRYLEVEGGLQTCEKVVSQEFGNPISLEHSDTVGTQAAASHIRKHETKNVSHPGLVEAENDQEKLSAFKRVMDADHSKHNEGSPYLYKHEKDISSTHTDGAELPKKSTVWGSLKSFADGLVSMWRKM